MRSHKNADTEDTKELLETFPELANEDVVWEKEIYAHFGLLYMGFALLEHSLINVATVKLAIEVLKKSKVRSQEAWSAAHESSFANCTKQTFGNLVKVVIKVREFAPLAPRLYEIKQVRDYFSHHFFRREAVHMGQQELALGLLSDMYRANQLVGRVELETRPLTHAYFNRLGLPSPNDGYIENETKRLKQVTKEDFGAGKVPRGIERWTSRGFEE
jgi:hypothetical protein